MFKGVSPLLQRIEFGEFEMCPLWQQSYLEDEIFEKEAEELKANMSGKFHEDTIKEAIADLNKKRLKREQQIKSTHIKQEQELIKKLYTELCKEFNVSPDLIWNYFENSDLTTRQLYYTLKYIEAGKEVPKPEEIDMFQWYIKPQPRHIMKRNEAQHFESWKNAAKKHKVW